MQALAIKAIGMVVVTAALFGSGYFAGKTKANADCEREKAEYREKQNQIKSEIQEVEIRVIEKLVPTYIEKIKTVVEKEVVYVQEAEEVVPDRFDLSIGWVHVHDSSARNLLSEASRSSDETPSGVGANKALSRVVKNYSICEQNRQQLINLQEWVRTMQTKIESINARNLAEK